ncbi:MAG TPA: hypothetical protein VGR26_14135 [Acidimicrobiales bacterium]|nr:hypothetical protein [Acidimicrobiales bacterium]
MHRLAGHLVAPGHVDHGSTIDGGTRVDLVAGGWQFRPIFGVELAVTAMLELPTVAELAATLDRYPNCPRRAPAPNSALCTLT